jgi:spoIIIJ-associated protein
MKIDTFLTSLCQHCGLDSDNVTIDIKENDDEILINLGVPEEDSGIFIGHHGEVIDSLQRIMRIIFQDKEGEESDEKRKRIILNINDYRERRKERLEEITRSVANRVLDTGNDYMFDSHIPSHERYVIHTIISDDENFADLESVSEGFGRNRRLVIRLKDEETKE